MASTYATKKGTKYQLNISIGEKENKQLDELCDGVPKSVVFGQWIKEKHLAAFGVQPTEKTQNETPPRKIYNILGLN